MLPRDLAEQERRDRTRVAKRLIVVPDEPLHRLDGIRMDNGLVMFGFETFRHCAGERPLIEAIPVLEPDRECLDRLTHHACH